MEAKVYDQEKTWPDFTPGITAKLLEISNMKEKTIRESQCYLQATNSSSSCMSHLIYSETPLEFSMVVGQCSVDELHEENCLDEELMDASDYQTTENSNKLYQPLSIPHSDKKESRTHEPSLLKCKHKAVSCSDFKCSSHRTHPNFEYAEAEDVEASSSEDEDIFTELPMSEEVLENLHKTYVSQTKQGNIHNIDVFPVMADNNHEEKKWNEHKTSLQVRDVFMS